MADRDWSKPSEEPRGPGHPAWIEELRRRTHDLANTTGAVVLQVEAMRGELRRLREEFDKMQNAQEVAEAVADELHKRRRWWLNAYTKAAAAVLVALNVAGAAKVLLG